LRRSKCRRESSVQQGRLSNTARQLADEKFTLNTKRDPCII